MQFDLIPYEDLKGDWHKLGSGSFGNVYKGTYLGTDVAIKEVLPSTDYDVRKYFEREWKLMREARHPNVVLFLGLSYAPDGRVFIISEFIENGNLRQYIFAKSKPFPWRLRLSFCIDIARALAYLHARKCVHRDIKGENLLLTSNGRLKITDFGFARITPRSPEEAKRLTYCGTDAYMSPEILMGDPFDLPTDVFSLGVIYCEIACRRVADDRTFKRAAPMYSLDPRELYALSSPGCPPELIQLALDCCSVFPAKRPSMVEVLSRLSAIEAQVLARGDEDLKPVGTIKFLTGVAGAGAGSRRPRQAPRIPSFGMGVGKDIRFSAIRIEDIQVPPRVSPIDVPASPPSEYGEEPETLQVEAAIEGEDDADDAPDEQDEPLVPDQPAVVKRTPSWAEYGSVMIGRSSMLGDRSGWSQADVIPSEPTSVTHLLDRQAGDPVTEDTFTPEQAELGSTITVRASYSTTRISPTAVKGPSAANGGIDPATGEKMKAYVDEGVQYPTPSGSRFAPASANQLGLDVAPPANRVHTSIPQPSDAPNPSVLSQASSQVLVHRFTLIRPASNPVRSNPNLRSTTPTSAGGGGGSGWSPLNFFFSPLTVKSQAQNAKCDLCHRRLGKAAALECDDCGMRCHVKCGEGAPRDCGVRFPRAAPAVPFPVPTGVIRAAPTPPVVQGTTAAAALRELQARAGEAGPAGVAAAGKTRSPPGSPGRWKMSPKLGMLGL